MYEALVTAVVKAGYESRFEELARQLRAATLEHDPGCQRYDWYRSTSNGHYLIFESWTDQACVVAHSRSAHFLQRVPQLEACMEGGFKQQTLVCID